MNGKRPVNFTGRLFFLCLCLHHTAQLTCQLSFQTPYYRRDSAAIGLAVVCLYAPYPFRFSIMFVHSLLTINKVYAHTKAACKCLQAAFTMLNVFTASLVLRLRRWCRRCRPPKRRVTSRSLACSSLAALGPH